MTHLKPIEQLGERATVIRARLETGRTHQIRIHCANLGHPVLGDKKYGVAVEVVPPRMALHACELRLSHPESGEKLAYSRPWPAPMEAWLAGLRESGILGSP